MKPLVLAVLIPALLLAQAPTGVPSGPLRYSNMGLVNITAAPFNASGYAAFSRATSNAVAGSSISLDFATVDGFSIGQYMYCQGMGTGGDWQRELITNIIGLTVFFPDMPIASVITPRCWTEGGTQTTGSTPIGTRVRVLSAATYKENQGIYIETAGTGGTQPHRARITGVNMATGDIDYTPTSIAVAVTGSFVQHDETAAFNLVHQSAKNTGTISVYIPTPADGFFGIYNVNGPALDTGTNGCNSILCTPLVTAAEPLQKFHYMSNGGGTPGEYPIIQTNRTGATASGVSLFGSPRISATTGAYSRVFLSFDRVNFRVSTPNPDIKMLNGSNMLGLSFRRGSILGTDAVTTPTHAGSVGIVMPYLANWVNATLEDVIVQQYATCVLAGEHTHSVGVLTVQFCGTGLKASNTQVSTLPGHPIIIEQLVAEQNVVGLDGDGPMVFLLYSAENNGTDILDNGMRARIIFDGLNGTAPTWGGSVAGSQSFVCNLTDKNCYGSIWTFASGAGPYPAGTFTSTISNGFSGIGGYSSGSVDKYRMGYGNVSSPFFPAKFFVGTVDATDAVIGANSAAGIIVNGATRSTGVQVGGLNSAAVCFMTDGKTLGHCTTAVGAGGLCTCSQ